MMTNYRDKALSADGDACQDCGSKENIEVHHVDGDRSNNDLENLEVLCRTCHVDRHRLFDGDVVEVSVPMSGVLNDTVEHQLEYGDSKAEYIREACRQRLEQKDD